MIFLAILMVSVNPHVQCQQPLKHNGQILASYYANKFEGHKTASGSVFHQLHLTAASLQYPLGTLIRIYCPETEASIIVEVTDRGPWGTRYKLDLSKAAFEALGIPLTKGWAWVIVEKVD